MANEMRKFMNICESTSQDMEIHGKELADKKAMDLQKEIKNGIPAVYNSTNDYLNDFYPDLPWDIYGQKVALERLLTKYKAIIQKWSETTGFDLEAELNSALNDIYSGNH